MTGTVLHLSDAATIVSGWARYFGIVSLRGFVFLLLVFLLARTLKERAAATRQMVWRLALLVVLLMPCLCAVAPAWSVPALPMASSIAYDQQHAHQQSTTLEAASLGLADNDSTRKGTPACPGQHVESNVEQFGPGRSVLRTGGERGIEGTDSGAINPNVITHINPSLALAFFAWLCVALSISFRTLSSWFRIARLARRCRQIERQTGLSLNESLPSSRRVMARLSEEVQVPMTFGMFRPMILLPAAFNEWPGDQQRSVLLHELAHAERRDCLFQCLSQLACAIYWFNPLVWIADRMLRLETELAADDMVIIASTKPSDYAGHLLEVARGIALGRSLVAAGLFLTADSHIESRVLAILDPYCRRTARKRGALLVVGSVLILTTPVAVIRPVTFRAPFIGCVSNRTANAGGYNDPNFSFLAPGRGDPSSPSTTTNPNEDSLTAPAI
jgi:beta-lactamase regulating signal transducer with metallopeptidase domain